MPPRKKQPEEAEEIVRVFPQRIPDYAVGDKGSLDNLLELDRVAWTRKRGVLTLTFQLVMSLNGVPTSGWPTSLAPYRGAVVAGMSKDGEVFEVTRHPKADVKLTLSSITNGTQDQELIFNEATARLSKIKLHAKPDNATMRLYFQLSGKPIHGKGDAILDVLGGSVLLSTMPLQQALFPTQPGEIVQ